MACWPTSSAQQPERRGNHTFFTLITCANGRARSLLALNRARERGQLPGDLDPELAIDLLTGPFFHRRFIAHRPIPPSLVDDVVAQVLGTTGRGATDDHAAAASTPGTVNRRSRHRPSR